MKSFLSDFRNKKPDPFRSNNPSHTPSRGTLFFANGVSYHGELCGQECHGRGRLMFPDGTSFEGIFQENRFKQGVITYHGNLTVNCTTRIDAKSDEDYMDEFQVIMPSGHIVQGKCKKGGNISKAKVLNPKLEPVAHFTGNRVEYRSPHLSDLNVVITKTWIYEGSLKQKNSAQAECLMNLELADRGTQIWSKGFGYLRSHIKHGMHCRQLFRLYRGRCFFKEILFQGKRPFLVAACFSNGTFYFYRYDSTVGVMVNIQKDNTLAMKPVDFGECVSSEEGRNAEGSTRDHCSDVEVVVRII